MGPESRPHRGRALEVVHLCARPPVPGRQDGEEGQLQGDGQGGGDAVEDVRRSEGRSAISSAHKVRE